MSVKVASENKEMQKEIATKMGSLQEKFFDLFVKRKGESHEYNEVVHATTFVNSAVNWKGYREFCLPYPYSVLCMSR